VQMDLFAALHLVESATAVIVSFEEAIPSEELLSAVLPKSPTIASFAPWPVMWAVF